MRRLVPLMVVLTLLLPAGALAAGQDAQLQRASALWSAQHLRNYSFRITIGCFCPAAARRPIVVIVRGGRAPAYRYVPVSCARSPRCSS